MIDLRDITTIYFGNQQVSAVYAPDGSQIWPVGGSAGTTYQLANIRVQYSSAIGQYIWASGLNYAFVVADLVDAQSNVIMSDVVCTVTAFSGTGFSTTTRDGRPAIVATGRGKTLDDNPRTCTITAVSVTGTINGEAFTASAANLSLTVTQEPNIRDEMEAVRRVGSISLGEWDIGSGAEEGDSPYAVWGPAVDDLVDTCNFTFDAWEETRTYWKYTSGAEEDIDIDTETLDTSDSKWRVISNRGWCVVSQNEGEAAGEIRITEENTSGTQRSARLILQYNNANIALEEEVLVIQDADQT